ncbi:histidine phosphatase family protein [Echinimonas agarilytica]|uniref:Histidine phosphatase family protein n=1 Tax=Echinimonas agarilytica TaxID=1215918 RepID=A0AA42B8N0_9GAMM|nr:histidine phosphatase family protein [Echinimonas agarilytica]MCM2681144.1 histidine phosphatase family protein [Echinimonas agarilytica]
MTPVYIDFLRHGPVAGLPALNGVTDVALAEGALDNMQRQAKRFAIEYQAVISSPKRRCRTFAERYSTQRDVSLHIEPQWQEFDFGDLDGVPFEQMNEQQRSIMGLFWAHSTNFELPGAECYEAFSNRIWSAWQHLATSNPQSTLVVTHGGVIVVLVALLMNIPLADAYKRLHVGYASMTRVCFYDDPKQARIEFIGAPLV